MKKIILSIVVLAGLGLTSCGNSCEKCMEVTAENAKKVLEDPSKATELNAEIAEACEGVNPEDCK
jgi:hypothetical protein